MEGEACIRRSNSPAYRTSTSIGLGDHGGVTRTAVQKSHFAEKVARPEGCHQVAVHQAAGGAVQ